VLDLNARSHKAREEVRWGRCSEAQLALESRDRCMGFDPLTDPIYTMHLEMVGIYHLGGPPPCVPLDMLMRLD
jgi:hypothetical protein